MCSLSYDAASGNIALGLLDGHVEFIKMVAYDPCAVSTPLPLHARIRTRLAIAQMQASAAEAKLLSANDGLRQRISREQELKRSIADLEAKCAYISNM